MDTLTYLNPPKGKKFEWPTDISINDAAYLRRYIKWKHPKAFKPELLPVTPLLDLVNYLTSKGYTFGEPVYGREAGNAQSKKS